MINSGISVCVSGQNATLLIIVTGVDMLFGVEVGLVSADGELLRNTSVTRLRDGTYLARVLHLPDVPFTLLLMGQEADGRPFQRQSSTQIQASQITVQVRSYSSVKEKENMGVNLHISFSHILLSCLNRTGPEDGHLGTR